MAMRFSRIRRVWWERVSAGALVVLVAGGCGDGERTSKTSAPIVKGAAPAPFDVVASVPVAVQVVAPPAEMAQPRVIAPPALVVPSGYAARLKLAKRLVRDGRVDDAELVYAQAAEDEPTRATPRIELARLRLAAKDVAGARKHAEAAVELAPESSGAWNTLGRVELLDGDKLAAIDAFTRAAEANPDNSYAWNNLGLVLGQLGRWDEAVAALERATGGAHPEAFMWSNLGVAYERGEQIELGRAAYRQAARAGSQVGKDGLARLEAPIGHQAKADVTPDVTPDVTVKPPVPDDDDDNDNDDSPATP